MRGTSNRRWILTSVLLAVLAASCSGVQTEDSLLDDPTVTAPASTSPVVDATDTADLDPGTEDLAEDPGDGPIPFEDWYSSTRIAEGTVDNMRLFIANQCFGLPSPDDCVERSLAIDESTLTTEAATFAAFEALDADQSEWCAARLLSVELLAELTDEPAPTLDGFLTDHPRCGPEGDAAPASVGLGEDCTFDGIPLSGLAFITTNAIVADLTIFEVPLRGDAQLRVWESEQDTQATGCGEWAYTEARLLADFTVYVVETGSTADLTVFFTETRSLAGLGDLSASLLDNPVPDSQDPDSSDLTDEPAA